MLLTAEERRERHRVREAARYAALSPVERKRHNKAAYSRMTTEQKQRAKAKAKAWHAANPTRAKAAKDAWRARNPGKVRANAWRRYGMDPVEAAARLAAHAGCCDICGGTNPGNRDWAVDHDRRTGRVRGILCRDCNLTLGLMGDNPQRLRAAATYLEKP